MVVGEVRRRPHDHDEFKLGKCPQCGVLTAFARWWCNDCLRAKVQACRAELNPCHCGEAVGPHRHAVEGGIL